MIILPLNQTYTASSKTLINLQLENDYNHLITVFKETLS